MTVKAGEFPELRIKAYAGRVLLAFLQTLVAGVCNTVGEPSEDILLVHAAMSEMCKWYLLVETSDRYLSTGQAQQIWDCSQRFLDVIATEAFC